MFDNDTTDVALMVTFILWIYTFVSYTDNKHILINFQICLHVLMCVCLSTYMYVYVYVYAYVQNALTEPNNIKNEHVLNINRNLVNH